MPGTNTRDEKILEHLGRYRISLRPILERLFFDGRTSGNVIQRLLKSGRIHSREGLPNRIRYYQLTMSEARKRSIPVGRSEPYAAQALNVHLGVLWLCCVEKANCHRVEEKALKDRFEQTLRGPLCIERDGDSHKMLHVRVATADTEDTNLLRSLRGDINDALDRPDLAKPMTAGQFAFVVLVDTLARKRSLSKTLAEHELSELADIQIHFAPSHETLAQALREL